jgi:hypothetical protein
MHKFNSKIYRILIALAGIIFHSCVEEIDVNIEASEQALVVETLITNEFKNQVIKLSKSYGFEESGSSPEMNAEVYIAEGSRQINFTETSPGIYTSVSEFAAQPNTPYKLYIERSNGIKYESLASEIRGVTSIDSIYVENIVDEFGNEFVSIYVDSYDPTGNSVYYRYEYEETFKIVAPYWTPFDLNVPTLNPKLILKTTEQQVCYGTDKSIDIIQKETSNLAEDKVSKFTVLSLNKEDPKIRTRYSLLVKQYVQSIDAFSYYKTLKNFSGSDNILSQNQPGFFEGNIYSLDDPQKNKVLGFFEVASVSYARVFFNYIDLFPDSYSPNYFIDCQEGTPPASDARDAIMQGTYKFYRDNPNYPNPLDQNEGPWIIVAAPCGDCTKLGSNVKPDYWED